MPGLRLLVFDRTCQGRHGLPGLTQAWKTGQWLYQGLGRLDAGFGAASWAEALEWLGQYAAPRPIAEIQYWGHGRFGQALLAGEVLDLLALAPGHLHHERLLQLRGRLQLAGESLWWFRTCETFGTATGHEFARRWTRFFDCRTAGHTHVIGFWQSGLHCLAPGAEPHWPVDEGVRRVRSPQMAAALPAAAASSSPLKPNTISCLHGRIPPGF